MKHTIKNLFLIIAMLGLLVLPTNVFANSIDSNSEKINIENIEVSPNGNGTIRIDMEEFKQMSVKEQMEVRDYITSIGIDNFKNEILESFNSKDLNDEVNLSKEPYISDTEIYKSRSKRRASTYDDEKRTYHLVEFSNDAKVEYKSLIGISVIIDDDKIIDIDGSYFDIEDMSAGGSYGRVRTKNYVSNDGENAGSTVNYTVYFKYYVGETVPLEYSENKVDYIIVHAGDF